MYSCCIHARHECDAMCSFVFCDRVSLFHSRSLFLPLVSRCLPQSRRCPVGVPSVRCEIVNSKMKSNLDSACMLVAFIHAMSATHCAHVCSVIVFLCFICVLRSRRWCLVACRCPVGVPSVRWQIVNSKMKSNLRFCTYACCIHSCCCDSFVCSFVFCDRAAVIHSCSPFPPLVPRCLPVSRRCPVGVPSVPCRCPPVSDMSCTGLACLGIPFCVSAFSV